MQSEFDEERHRSQIAAKEALKDAELAHKRQLESLRKEGERMAQERSQQLEDLRKKHDLDVASLREKLTLEKEEWQGNYMKKVESQMRQREKAFREQLIQQRDAEIEMVIQRLESESGSSTSDATRRYRMDIERIKAETADEIKEVRCGQCNLQLRDQHSMALDKLLLAKKQIADLEASLRETQKENLQAQHAIMAKDSLLKRQKDELQRLAADETTLMEQISTCLALIPGCDFEHDLESYKKQVETLQIAMDAAHELAQSEIKQLQGRIDQDETLRQVESQVRAALASKDQAISQLQSQCEEEKQRADQLERLMEQQRNELLGL
ncbi:hypothetical protein HDU91_001346 [Kappamyces sp. JEL0680]|nr:hypothetical protein HDU91_001346 [Kappamyces sp. JEL0680]